MIRSPAGFGGDDRIKRYLDYYQAGNGVSMLSPGNVFSPSSLFAASEQGVWYDPSDFSTMFQDSAGTVPVTAVGQVVGLILDKSGRNNHASQTGADANKPTLQTENGLYFLLFANDALSTGTITAGTNKAQIFAGVRKLSDAAGAILAEYSASYTSNLGSFNLGAPYDTTTQRYGAISRGNAVQSAGQGSYVTGTGAAPDTAVLTATFDIAGDSTIIRRNGTAFAAGTVDQGTGNYGNYPLYLGRRGGTTAPYDGRLYGLILRFGANLSADTIVQTENWLNARTGAY